MLVSGQACVDRLLEEAGRLVPHVPSGPRFRYWVRVIREPDLASRYGIQSIPTLLFFKGGQVVKQQIGAVPRPVLEKIVKELV